MSDNKAGRPRARDLGVPFEGRPGRSTPSPMSPASRSGTRTLISGEGPLQVGDGPVRTGVTAILPRGPDPGSPLFAGWFSLNGNGEMTGTAWIEESGLLEGPVCSPTRTASAWSATPSSPGRSKQRRDCPAPWSLPVVAETYDGCLNDINGFHVKAEHVFAALDGARSGPVAEGNVGGGTGHDLLRVQGRHRHRLAQLARQGGYTVGVLVQANYGCAPSAPRSPASRSAGRSPRAPSVPAEAGSIIIVARHRRAAAAAPAASGWPSGPPLGLARTGSVAGNGSGDIFLAFSTANLRDADASETVAA